MKEAEKFRVEMACVLADPAFARSPVLTRLLEYLTETTLRGEGKGLKSYSVAVEGLGRSPDFDSQVDTYARVQVARLRKALDIFYASAGASRAERLHVGNGSYEVRLVPNAGAAPKGDWRGWLAPLQRLGRKRLVAAALALLALIVAIGLFCYWHCLPTTDLEKWRTPNFPYVDVKVTGNGARAIPGATPDDLRQTMLVSLSPYEGIRTLYLPGRQADYDVNMALKLVGGHLREEVFIVYRRLNRIVWTDVHRFGPDPATWADEMDAYHDMIAFRVGHPTGAIHSFERRWNHDSLTPYGCWLRFSAQLQGARDFGDKELKTCATQWYDASPNYPMAAALKGWILLDASVRELTDAARQSDIAEATGLIEQAAALNPTSAFVRVCQTRAYSYSGDYDAMRKAALEAVELNPTNLDVQGMVGTTLALWNDPQGEAMAREAAARHFNPQPWYYVGIFIGAMMREDTLEARQALRKVTEFNHTLPVLAILSAALDARTGNLERARAEWAVAESALPMLRVQPTRVFERLPMAPVVRRKLLAWLAPVL